MQRHPNGETMTLDLLKRAGFSPGARILDLGAGDGDTVRLMRGIGLLAEGVDLAPGTDVAKGDILNLPYEDGTFDGAIAECVFSVCGDTLSAFREAYRVLKSGGNLILSDVYLPKGGNAAMSLPYPADRPGWEKTGEGFCLTEFTDFTSVWTDYILDCVWHGIDIGDCGYFTRGEKFGYFGSLWIKK